jgi:hypothetical protein
MSVSETTPTDSDQYGNRFEHVTHGAFAFVVRFLRELVLLNAFAGWFALWGLTAYLNYRGGDTVGLGLVVGLLILPGALAALWHVGAVVTGGRMGYPWQPTGDDGPAAS